MGIVAVRAICAVLASLALVFTAPQASAEDPIVFSDTFTSSTAGERWLDGSTNGEWEAIYDGYGQTSVVADTSGQALAQAPQASTSVDETHGSLVTSRQSFGDIDFTARLKTVRQLRTPVPNPWETAWVLWNFTDDHHFYYLALKTNGWELVKEDPAPLVPGAGGCEWPTYLNCKYPGAQRYLVTSTTPTFGVGSWHDVRVRQVGGTIDIWANGQHLTTFVDNDAPYRSGKIGLYNEDADVRFDDVVVRTPSTTAPVSSPAAGGVTRLSGSDRYSTAAAIAKRVSPNGAATAVVASGANANLIDSLVAGPLAVANDAPLFLTAPDRLPPVTASAIADLGVERVMVVGGPMAVSDGVLGELRGLGVTVERISGPSAPDTAALVAARVGLQHGAVVVSRAPQRLVDGLASAGPAGALGRPILLTTAEGAPTATTQALRGVEDVWVVGGEAAVPSSVVSQLGARRIAGADRWSTAVAIARAASEAGATPSTVVVSSGEDAHLVDALAASALGGPVLLAAANELPSSTALGLAAIAPPLESVVIAGGTSSISDPVAAAVQAAIA